MPEDWQDAAEGIVGPDGLKVEPRPMTLEELEQYFQEQIAREHRKFAEALENERRIMDEAVERRCSAGDCIGLFGPGGQYLGGWGPTGCPHEEEDW